MSESYTQINRIDLGDFIYATKEDRAENYGKDILDFLNNPDSFRTFSKGLTELLQKSGYTGADTPEAKTDYLYQKLQNISSGITKELLLQWFQDEEKRPIVKNDSRKNMYEICFALQLPLDKVRWFFSHVYYDRSFNCHCLEEAVYYFCFKNSLSYAEAKDIIHTVEQKEAPESFFKNTYTYVITATLDNLTAKDELITYLVQNKATFEEGHWNQLALDYVKELQQEILNGETTSGIIKNLREGKNIPEQETKKCGLLVQEIYKRFPDTLIKKLKGCHVDSNDFLLSKILEHDVNGISKNAMLPVVVKQNFPRKNDLCAILKHADSSRSYDSIRKTLILLKFYSFWCNALLESEQPGDYSSEDLAEAFEEETDNLLLECGYEELAACNPYDWLYLSAARQDDPLMAFRNLIAEIIETEKD